METSVEKPVSDYKFDLSAKTTFEFKLVDYENASDKIDVSVAKNTPEIEEELSAFLRIKKFKDKNFIFGPFLDADITMKFDYKDLKKDKNYNFVVEKFFQKASFGVKIGYNIENLHLIDSKITFLIPFSNYLRVHDEDDFFPKPDTIHEMVYSTNLYIGANPAILLNIKPRIGIIKFKFENYGFFAAQIINTSYKSNGYFLEEKNILNFEVAPFNLIRRDVNVWFGLNNKFVIDNDSYKSTLYNRAYFEIFWNGLEFFEISFTPIKYVYEVKIPNNNYTLPYDQEQYISMDISFKFYNKFVEFKVGYEPTIWGMKRTQINDDNIKPHIIKTSIEFKF